MITQQSKELVEQLTNLNATQVGTITKDKLSALSREYYLAMNKRSCMKFLLYSVMVPFQAVALLQLLIKGAESNLMSLLCFCLILAPFIGFMYLAHLHNIVKSLEIEPPAVKSINKHEIITAYSSLLPNDLVRAKEIISKHASELVDVENWLSSPDRELIYAELAAIERYSSQRA